MRIKTSSGMSAEPLSLPWSCHKCHTGQVLGRCKFKCDHSRPQPAYLSKWSGAHFSSRPCSAQLLPSAAPAVKGMEETPSNTTLFSQFVLNYVNKCIYFYKIGIILHFLFHSTIPFIAHTLVNCAGLSLLTWCNFTRNVRCQLF